MTAHKVAQATLDPGRKMSLIEVARGLREGRFEVKRIRRWSSGTYRLYLGSNTAIPDTYDIREVEPGVIMVRLGVGEKKVLKTKKDAWVTIPAKYARGREGPVLVERVDERTLIVYLG